MSYSKRTKIILAMLLLAHFLLGCAWLMMGSSEISSSMPRWVCPTPTPLAYGDKGPVKEHRDGEVDPTTGIPEREAVYYEIWEQEYGALGDPAPAPTPYSKTGTTFYFGQLVNYGSGILDLQLDIEATSVMSQTEQLYLVQVSGENHENELVFFANRQIALNDIREASGRKLAGTWLVSRDAMQQAGIDVLPDVIPAGRFAFTVPIFAPIGTVEGATLKLDLAEQADGLRVNYIHADEPDCGQPGTIAAHYADGYDPVVPPVAPEGTDAMVAWALAQVGRPYCWGGKGYMSCDGYGWGAKKRTPSCPEQGGYPCWDCSGLTWGAYNAVGTVIGHGTSNQALYPRVSIDQIAVGDLMLFGGINEQGRGTSITHVGLYVGDVTGDGTGDMIHAAQYPDGVVVSNNILGNSYYRPRLVVITRPPRT
jgi:hypothetical protein